MKMAQNSRFKALIDLKITETPFLLKIFFTLGVVELYLFKVSEVIYAPSRRIRVKLLGD
jgi:hypothetical protein